MGGRRRPVCHTCPALPTHLPAPCPAEESEEESEEDGEEEKGDDSVQRWMEDSPNLMILKVVRMTVKDNA